MNSLYYNNLPPLCKFCGSRNLSVLPGKGPHAAELRCMDCDRHQKWISKAIADELEISAPPKPTFQQFSIFEGDQS